MSKKNSQGNPKFSRLRLRSAASVTKKSSSPHVDPREKISSYFSLTTASQVESEELFTSVSQSQCGQQLTTNSEPTNEENDFAESKLLKPVKSFEIKVEKESKITRKRTRNKNNLNRFIKDLGPSCSDTNQENLQLAIAMSKSISDYENLNQNNEDENDSPYPSTQQKIAGIKKTLDQFGFKSDRNPIEFPAKNNPKQKRKFKYLTPTLFLRTEEERKKIIENKVSGILTNISVYNKNTQCFEETQNEFVNNKPKSFILRDYYDEDSSLFNKNNLDVNEIMESTYYNKIVPKEVVKTGVLLKDWHSIPGREKTPPINIIVEETENIQDTQKAKEDVIERDTNKLEVSATNRSISPELFSDSETELSKTPLKNSFNQKSPKSSSSKTLSPVILISSNSKNSPVINEKEIFSDDSEAKSLSLLDNISPHRNKKSARKLNKKSSAKKKLFKNNSESLLDDISYLNKSSSPIKSDSPVKTFEDSQILHYESFRDNSNDCFDLTKSSDDSNDIFNQDTIIQPITSQVVDVPISDNLFSNDFDFEIRNDNFVSKYNEAFDLTQSSNDSNAMNTEKNDLESKSMFKNDSERTSLWKENNMAETKENCLSLNENSLIKNNFNNSIKTIFLDTTDIIENTETNKKLNISIEQFNKSVFLNSTSVLIEENSESIKTELQNKIFSDMIKNTENIITDSNETKSVILKPSNYLEEFKMNTVQNLENDDYSPELNILNSSNNKEFYDSLNKSESVISDSESDTSEKNHSKYRKMIKRKSLSPDKSNIFSKSLEANSPSKFTSNSESDKSEKSYAKNKKNINRKSWSPNKSNFFSKSFDANFNSPLKMTSDSENEKSEKEYLKNKKIINRKSLSPNKSNVLNKSSENFDTTPKRKSTSFRKSFSENFIGDKEFNFISNTDKTNFFKLSSPLNITKFHTAPNNIELPDDDYKFNLSDVEISDEEINYSVKESTKTDQNKSLQAKNISVENPNEDFQYLSQSSVDTNSDISDEELNYSTNNSFRIRQLNKEIENILNSQESETNFMDFNDLPHTGFEPSSSKIDKSFNYSKTQPEIQHPRVKDLKTPVKLRRSFSESCVVPNENKTPENNKNTSIVITPNNDYIIKTKDVTPMPNFQGMNTPEIRKELDKYGIKPLKRAKGIKILQYIYDATHPVLDKSEEKIRKSSSDDEDGRIIKRRKKNVSPKLREQNCEKEIECIGNEIAESETIEDMIFERKQSVRIPSCRIPLHIVWYNLVSSTPDLHEKILLYEPIQVEEIYAKLKSLGYKFHIQDIITFLDKKCITIRVAQNQKKPTAK